MKKNNIRLHILKGGVEKKIIFDTPGKHAVFFHNTSGEYEFMIDAEGVELSIYGVYTGFGTDSFQLSTIQNHRAPVSVSTILVKGVFAGASRFVYHGLIRIGKNAVKSHAYQKNQNLMLGEHVFVESKPDLEILADDVFCTHGSTTGRLNKRDLEYASLRGLDVEEATQLLTGGFIRDVFDTMAKDLPAALVRKAAGSMEKNNTYANF